ncbi:MAG: endonuclease, partial [Thermoanaerobaculia bacterium]
MRRLTLWLALSLVCSTLFAADPAVFINEFHYDNTGGDTGEFIEIAGPAGTNLTGYVIELYNG